MKKIIWIILGLVVMVILAGMYKFNYLANQSGYDVDGNKVELSYYEKLENECKARASESCCMASLNAMKLTSAHKLEEGQECENGYEKNMLRCMDTFIWCEKEGGKKEGDEKELQERLKRLGIEIEKVYDEIYNKDFDETVFPGFQPIKNLSEANRIIFRDVITDDLSEISKKNIQKNFSGIKDEDFKNTGKLKYQADFDILLNNILIRIGLEPQNREHLESIIDSLEIK